jgi:hypothetical protein
VILAIGDLDNKEEGGGRRDERVHTLLASAVAMWFKTPTGFGSMLDIWALRVSGLSGFPSEYCSSRIMSAAEVTWFRV